MLVGKHCAYVEFSSFMQHTNELENTIKEKEMTEHCFKLTHHLKVSKRFSKKKIRKTAKKFFFQSARKFFPQISTVENFF